MTTEEKVLFTLSVLIVLVVPIVVHVVRFGI